MAGKNQTVKAYKQTFKHLLEFENDVHYNLNFDTVDNNFYTEFVNYLKCKKHRSGEGYSMNTIGKHIKNIKAFMNAGVDAELHSNFKFKKFPLPNEQTTAIYLTLEEQKRMLDLDLSKNKALELARDVFIIGCEIGQRISGYHNLQIHSIVSIDNEKYIKIKQQKTGNEVLCRITPAISKIINERYNAKLPPKILKQKLNNYIKGIGRLANIDETIKLEHTQGLKKKQIIHLNTNY